MTSIPTELPIRFDAFSKCFMQGEQRLPGLLPILQERFYPHYTFTKATFNRDLGSDETEHKQRKRCRANISRSRGQRTGVTVDKQMVKTVEILNRIPDLPVQCFWNPKALQKASVSCGLAAADKEELNKLIPQTKQIWKRLQRMELTPIGAQVIIWRCNPRNERYKYVHAADLECLDKSGRVVLVEIKCGFKHYLNACTAKRMREPFTHRNNSVSNHHQLQLANQIDMYRHSYPERAMGDSFILYVERDNTTVAYLQSWARKVTNWPELLFPTPAGNQIHTNNSSKKTPIKIQTYIPSTDSNEARPSGAAASTAGLSNNNSFQPVKNQRV